MVIWRIILIIIVMFLLGCAVASVLKSGGCRACSIKSGCSWFETADPDATSAF